MYEKIFEDIVDIIHHDYAGCKDKKNWDHPEEFKAQIHNDLTPLGFTELVKDYLADLKDPHMFFGLTDNEKTYRAGFQVRRYKDALFVTKVTQEKQLEVGDKILALDDIPVLELVELHKRRLMENEAEREQWRDVLTKHQTALVEKKTGEQLVINLSEYEKEEYQSVHSMKKLNDNTLYLKMTDFLSPDPIDQVISENKGLLEQTENLIVDVRFNLGGADSAFENLLKYLFPNQENLIEMDYRQEFNFTDRNANLVIQRVNAHIEEVKSSEFVDSLKRYMQMWEKHRGKGFIDLGEENSLPFHGSEYPKNIIVLSDVTCASAGDIFVEACKQSDKVTVIGRATGGVNDYSNLINQSWIDRFELMYPTSRLKKIDRGEGMTGIGIKPDIYIPWTPEHLERDVVLDRAFELLKNKETSRTR